jgi:hypothetical protein
MGETRSKGLKVKERTLQLGKLLFS